MQKKRSATQLVTRLLIAGVCALVSVSAVGLVGARSASATSVLTIDAGDQPTAIAFAPNGATAYVSNRGDNTVSVINTSTHGVTRTVHLPTRPGPLAVSPDGTKVYVADTDPDVMAISMISTQTFAVTQIPIDGHADDLAFSPDGSKAYVTSADYRFEIVDARQDRYSKEVVTQSPALGVVFAADGTKAYITTHDTFDTVNVATDSIIFTGTPAGVFAAALTPDGSRALVPVVGTPEIVNLGGWMDPQAMKNPGEPAYSIAAAPRGSRAYAATDTTSIPIYDVGTNSQVDSLTAPGSVDAVAVRPDSLELWAAMDNLDQIAVFPTPRPVLDVHTSRIQGVDRYQNSVDMAKAEFNPGASNHGHAPVVYIATGANFPDALSAGPAAVAHGGALLLTPSNELPDFVRQEIVDLTPDSLVIVGGSASITAPVRAELTSLVPPGNVTEIAGVDRYVNSRELLETFWAAPPTEPHGVYVATGGNFPDALSAGAAAGMLGLPVLLVDGSANPTNSIDAIGAPTQQVLEKYNVNRATVVGGPGSVDDSVMYSLAYSNSIYYGSVTREWGNDRFTASVNTNADVFASASTVYLASGLNFPDALVGGVLAGSSNSPLYIVWPNCVPSRVIDEIARLHATNVILLGGTGSLSPAIDSLTECAS